MDSAREELKLVLRAWKKDQRWSRFVYWFGRHYPPGTTNPASLDKPDANTLAVLQPLAAELGFSVYLAEIELVGDQRIYVESYGGAENQSEESGEESGRDSDDELDPNDFDGDNMFENLDVNILHASDLTGLPIKLDGLKIDLSCGGEDWDEVMINGSMDFEPFEKLAIRESREVRIYS